MNNTIGITERGDAALDLSWMPWVRSGKPAILITKDPGKLFNELVLHPEESHKFNVIIHATITGLGGSVFEPNVPKPNDALKAFKELSYFFSSSRVVLRIDPVIPVKNGISLAKSIIKKKISLVGSTERTRISFIDQYPHVKQRFKELHTSLPWDSFHAPLEIRQGAYQELAEACGKGMTLEICGEPGFECTGCVSEIDCKVLGVDPLEFNNGQRKFCACLSNKQELLSERKQCPHKCLYCYWKPAP